MQYRILGPLEVVQDGVPLDLGSPKQRAVLATLLLEAGRVVSAERIVDQVWSDTAPPNVSASLQAYVSNLRRLLREDEAASPILRQPPGYRLDAAAQDIDAQTFLSHADAASAAVRASDWAGATQHAQAALDLWRGPLLADFADEQWVATAAVALEERRADTVEALVTGLLGSGRTAPALSAARGLWEAQPLRERAAWLFVLALHRDGRTTEALEQHRAIVRHLDDELGLEPGPALRELQGAILRHDPEIAAWPGPGAATAPAPVAAPAPQQAITPPAPQPAGTTLGPALVGRGAELAVADEALDGAAAGLTRWLVLSGPAGIGKTRLAEEAMARAAAREFRVLRAHCPDDDGVPAWWPISQLVRAVGADPQPVLAQDPDAEADRARFAVYERVRELLAGTAAHQPLAVLVDDVQWADPSSLGLLAHLAALDTGPVLFVLTARAGVSGSDLTRLFETVARRPGNRRVAVPPLSGPEVDELVRQVSGEQVGADESALLVTRTGGNPFFVSEYARLPRAEREAGEIPLAVRSVLDRRLEALDAGTLQVLRTAAVISDVLDIGLLRRVTRLDVDELADLLDEAADERIVVVAPGSRHYAFAHGLLRDGLLAGMPATRRQRLHARVADALGGAQESDDLVRRAGHLLAALPLADPDEVYDACRSAALDADANWQTDSAAYWWESAITALDALGPARRTPEVRDDLVRRRLAALIRAGRGQTVYETVDHEVRRALAEGRPAAVGALSSILMRSAGAWPWAAVGQRPGPLVATLADAEQKVAADPAAHARVLGALAIGSCYHPDGSVPDGLSRRALELAEHLDDTEVLSDALLARALTFSGVAERAHESRALLDRFATLPHAQRDSDEVLRHGMMTMVCASLGEMAEAAEHCRLGILGSDDLRLPTSRVQFRLTESLLAIHAGRYELAEQLYRDGVSLREQTELYFGWARIGLVVSRWEQGRVASLRGEPGDADDILEDVIESAALALHDGDPAAADALVTQWLAVEGPVTWTSHSTWAMLAHLVADGGFTHHAPVLHARLAPLEDMIATVGQLTAAGPIALALARLDLLMGDADAARRRVAIAADLAERSGGQPSLLRCRLFAAELDGAPADDVRALAEQARALGVGLVAQRADALLTAA